MNSMAFRAARYFYTSPRKLKNRVLNTIDHPVVTLLYHRVNTLAPDPHLLTVTPEHFHAHLKFLKDNFHIVRFEEDWSALKGPAVAVTFDDGYADNALEALPVLEAVGAPATFFISTGVVDAGQVFWWDELERIVLGNWPCSESFELDDSRFGRSWPTGSDLQRNRLYRDIYPLMKKIDSGRRNFWLVQLRQWARAKEARSEVNRPMTLDELRRTWKEPLGYHRGPYYKPSAVVFFVGGRTAEGNRGLQKTDGILVGTEGRGVFLSLRLQTRLHTTDCAYLQGSGFFQGCRRFLRAGAQVDRPVSDPPSAGSQLACFTVQQGGAIVLDPMIKVSVIIPTYNYAKFIPEAIRSVLDQTFCDFELIIVDDGSTDETREVIKPYLDDARVKYVYQENKGLSSARNLGITTSRGEYIAFLDADDLWMPEKLQKQVPLLESNHKVALIYSMAEQINHEGKAMPHLSWPHPENRYL